jgi:hypothetical protein
MPYYFTVIAQVFTAQACRVRVITHISPQELEEAPPSPSLSSIGSFHRTYWSASPPQLPHKALSRSVGSISA